MGGNAPFAESTFINVKETHIQHPKTSKESFIHFTLYDTDEKKTKTISVFPVINHIYHVHFIRNVCVPKKIIAKPMNGFDRHTQN